MFVNEFIITNNGYVSYYIELVSICLTLSLKKKKRVFVDNTEINKFFLIIT